MRRYVYIDESGDTGNTKKSSRYFIVTAIYTDDVVVLRRAVRDVCKSEKIKSNQFHTCKESDRVKHKLLRKLCNIHIRCFAVVIDKEEIIVDDPYYYGLEKMAEYLVKMQIDIGVIAQKDTRKSYNQKIIDMFKKLDIDVILIDSNVEKALQVADFFSWSMYVHLQMGYSEYYMKMHHMITLL